MKEKFLVIKKDNQAPLYWDGDEWSRWLSKGLRYDTYSEAQAKIVELAKPDQFYAIEKLFVKS